jgi:branched-subunit amino acid transport protein
MSKAQVSALSGVCVAVLSALVSFGVLGGEEASAIQGVTLSLIAFLGTVAIRSARPPRS